MIKAYTNENDTVLDIFMGSGSTAIACKLSNRNYIGCESNNKYIKLMRERIDSYATLSTVTQFLK